MTADEAFLRDIAANPDDDATRLIYADWLDENGDPARAEFIRVQIGLASLPEEDDRRWPLLAREQVLLAAHEGEWRRPFEQFFSQDPPAATLWTRVRGLLRRPGRELPRATGTFERGFLQSIDIGHVRLLSEAEQYARTHPLVSLQFSVPDRVESFWLSEPGLHLPHLRKLTLRIEGRAIIMKVLLQQIPSFFPFVAHLNADIAALDLFDFGWIRRLQSLEVSAHNVGSHVSAMASLSRTDENTLVRLHLRSSGLTPRGAQELVRTHGLPHLRELDLSGNELLDPGAAAIIASPLAAQLRKLCLSHNGLGPATGRAIAATPALSSLTHLDLSGNSLGDVGARALASAGHLRNLVRLDLSGCEIGANGLSALARSEHLAGLRSLLLSSLVSRTSQRLNRLGDQGATLLARTSWLTRLTRLELRHTGIGAEGTAVLAQSEALSNLRSLDLTGNDIGDQGVRALIHSPHLGKLQQLRVDLRSSHISAWARRAVRERFEDAFLSS